VASGTNRLELQVDLNKGTMVRPWIAAMCSALMDVEGPCVDPRAADDADDGDNDDFVIDDELAGDSPVPKSGAEGATAPLAPLACELAGCEYLLLLFLLLLLLLLLPTPPPPPPPPATSSSSSS